jgi:hypothetical protein
MKTCAIKDCNKPAKTRGWCPKHYARWRRHSDPNQVAYQYRRCSKPGSTAVQQFWELVNQNGPTMPHMQTPCWIWTGGKIGNGYGGFRIDGHQFLVHRFAYETVTGEELGEKEIDHICHNTLCVNPTHLRPATRKQNLENRRIQNKTGVHGVNKWGNKFRARITHNGKQYYLGLFNTKEEAGEVARLKRLELFTHNDADHNKG